MVKFNYILRMRVKVFGLKQKRVNEKYDEIKKKRLVRYKTNDAGITFH